MKNTKKKLKAKSFRYLTKEIINDPFLYLDDLYDNQLRLEEWLTIINRIVILAAVPEFSPKNKFESGYGCQQLIQHVEMAYVIFHTCDIELCANPLNNFLEDDLHYTNCEDTLSRFFSYQSLDQWYKTLDKFAACLTINYSSDDDRFGDKIIALAVLLIALARSMHYM